MRDPTEPPWWWLREDERRALGLGASVARTARGFVLGDPGAPFRLEVLPRDESAPVKLGSVSLRILGDSSRPDARRAIYEAARALHERRGRGFDPAALSVPFHASDADVPESRALSVIEVPTRCDRSCVFCHRSLQPVGSRQVHRDEASVERALEAATGDVLFTGDDALSHPRIAEWIARASQRGAAVSLIGPIAGARLRLLSAQLRAAGLQRIVSGLFGADAALHDHIAGRNGAFDALLEAREVLAASSVTLELVTPLIRPLLPHLPAIELRARALTGRPPALLAYVPDTEVGQAFDAIVPRWGELRDALSRLGEHGARPDALPLCTLPPSWRTSTRLERTDRGLSVLYPEEVCGRCSARPACPGVASTVLRAVGTEGLTPIGSR